MFKILEEDGLEKFYGLEKFLNRNEKHLSELVKLEKKYLLLNDLANPFVEEDVLREGRAALKALAGIYKEMLELHQKFSILRNKFRSLKKRKSMLLSRN